MSIADDVALLKALKDLVDALAAMGVRVTGSIDLGQLVDLVKLFRG